MTDTNDVDSTLTHRTDTTAAGCACWYRDNLFEEIARDCPVHGTDAINRALVEHVNDTLDMVQQLATQPAPVLTRVRCESCGGPGALHWGDCERAS